jgi:hypothetical protein
MAKKRKPKAPKETPAATPEPEKTKTPEPAAAAEPSQEAAESITERLKRQATDDAARADGNAKRTMSVVKRESRRVPVKLNDMAIAKSAKLAAEQFKVLQDAREDAKKKIAEIKKGVQEKEVEHAKLMSALDTGIGEELVTCEDRMDWDSKLVLSVRLDLPEDDPNFIMERRTMTEAELQYPLKLDPIQEPTKLDAAKALTKVGELADAASAPAPTWHRDGKLCRKGDGCKRPHVNPELLRKAGVKDIEQPALVPDLGIITPPVDEAVEVSSEYVTAPSPESGEPWTSEDVRQLEAGANDEAAVEAAVNGKAPIDPNDWRRQDPKTMFRGRHMAPPDGDGANCFRAGECDQMHTQGIEPNPDAPNVFDPKSSGEGSGDGAAA